MTRIVLAFLFATAIGADAQTPPPAAAVQLRGSEIDNALQRTAEQLDSDQLLRVLNIGNDYNLEISVVHRARTGGRQIPAAAEHTAITEIFHFIAGTGTLVTGGTLAGPQQSTSDPLSGPTVLGTRIADGTIRAVGPGDVVVIPPNTPVQITEVNSGELVYLVVRVDPHSTVAQVPH